MANYNDKINEIVETAEQRVAAAAPKNRVRHAVAWIVYLQSMAQRMMDTATPEEQEIISSALDAGYDRIHAAEMGAA